MLRDVVRLPVGGVGLLLGGVGGRGLLGLGGGLAAAAVASAARGGCLVRSRLSRVRGGGGGGVRGLLAAGLLGDAPGLGEHLAAMH